MNKKQKFIKSKYNKTQMAKSFRQITETQFKIGIAVIIILFIGLLYYAVIEDRLQVRESDVLFVEDSLIKNQPLVYKTEFCANKLSNLAHEIHFFERDIKEETELIKRESTILDKEQKVLEIEQEELNELKSEFEKYKKLCDEFDQKPTKDLCNQFLKEAKQGLESAPEDKKAARIYKNLLKECQE